MFILSYNTLKNQFSLYRSVFNVEDLGCPALERIEKSGQFNCYNHDLCERRPVCAMKNVLTIRAWLWDYFEGKVGQDEVDNLCKSDISMCLYVS